MRISIAAALITQAFYGGVAAHAAGLDLARYRLANTFALPASTALEASAVTYNWDAGTLFVVGDEGGDPAHHIVQVTTGGAVLNSMLLTGFADTEGLTYIGDGKLVITEERLQDAYLVTYSAGGSGVVRSSLPTLSLGDTVGNIGIEGISFEQGSGKYYVVKEKSPQAVNEVALDFATPAATVASLFTPDLGVLDLSDVQVLSSVVSLHGTAAAENLLIFSQESSKLLEVTRGGGVVSEFDFAAIAGNVEGVTIDPSGTIFLVGENPSLYVLTPVPEPETYAMFLAGLGVLVWWRRRCASI